MRKYLMIVGIILAATACGVAAYFLNKPLFIGQEKVGRSPLWDAFNYQQIAGPKEQQFIILCHARIEAAQGATNVRGRVVFAMQDKINYYFVELKPDAVSLGKVENGFELHIGTRSAKGLSPGDKHEVIIKRHSAPISVAVDGEVVATAYDDTFGAGDLAFGSIGNTVTFSNLKVQPIGEVYRSDDFMRNEGEQSLWEIVSGNWQVNALNNPTMSTNAFYYIGSGPGEATVTWGFWFWDDYSFRVACKPMGEKSVGIYTYYRDKDNFYLFKWMAASIPSPKMQLIRCVKGVQTVLCEKAGGYVPNQWYVLRCDVTGTKIRTFVDDVPMLEVDDPMLCLGKVGLYVDSLQGAQFDDALVKSIRYFSEDFRVYTPGKWIELGGSWRLASEGGVGNETAFLHGSMPSGGAKVVSGESHWCEYILTADIGPCPQGRAGLCFYYQDELNYYAFLWGIGADGRTGRQLIKVLDGKHSVLAHDAAPPLEQRARICIKQDKGHITVSHLQKDGTVQQIFEEFDNSLTEGKIGLMVESAPDAVFGNVHVEFLTEKPSLMTVHEVFSRERTMEDWAGEQSDWAPRTDTVAGVTFQTNWHRADFPGDVDIEMKTPHEFPKDGQIKLMVACKDENIDSGYCFTLGRTGSYKATLMRRGQVVGSSEFDEKTGLDQLLFRRTGSYIVAFLGPRAILSYRDREPLNGVKVGWSATQVPIRNQDIQVYSDCVQNYSFKEAASDWRVAAGIWEVTNRWQCDPRWSFFCGRSPRLAAIWNKRELVGDVTLEFYAAIKMDAERGRRYEYASDMNATLCGDGQDLTSGYNFLFGGWHDQRTAITKKDKILVETASKVIPREDNIHRRWFYLKARKHGNRLEFYVDNSLVLEYTDPEPLTGRYAAIWTYNNGLMVSRVRLSCTDARKKESPLLVRSNECKCIYDLTPPTPQPPTGAKAQK